jgi:hypothetical protein
MRQMVRSVCALIVSTPKRKRRPSTAQELSIQTRPRFRTAANLGLNFPFIGPITKIQQATGR